MELGDDGSGELIGVDRLVGQAGCCAGVGQWQVGVSVCGGDWGVQPGGAAGSYNPALNTGLFIDGIDTIRFNQ